jgi:hypothetical protein
MNKKMSQVFVPSDAAILACTERIQETQARHVRGRSFHSIVQDFTVFSVDGFANHLLNEGFMYGRSD